ncbi:MAG: hypothetical protein JOZ41_14285 [Chloroflexi bacterium]|nr:hypothetical protein [Chloroflexota bacterium]
MADPHALLTHLKTIQHSVLVTGLRDFLLLARTPDDESVALERFPDELRDRAESLMLIVEGAVARGPVVGGAAAARCARRLAARPFADPPSRADNPRRVL